LELWYYLYGNDDYNNLPSQKTENMTIKSLLLSIFIFSSSLVAETNSLDKTFLNITMTCRIFIIFDSPDKSQEAETNCIRTKLKENNLSKAKFNEWSKDYWTKRKEAWNKFLNNLEEK